MVILMVIVGDLSKCVCLIHDSSGFILRGMFMKLWLCVIPNIFYFLNNIFEDLKNNLIVEGQVNFPPGICVIIIQKALHLKVTGKSRLVCSFNKSFV